MTVVIELIVVMTMIFFQFNNSLQGSFVFFYSV